MKTKGFYTLTTNGVTSLVKLFGGYPVNWVVNGIDVLFPEQTVRIGDEDKLRGGAPPCSPYWSNWPTAYNPGMQHGWLRHVLMSDWSADEGEGSFPSTILGFSGIPAGISAEKYPWILEQRLITDIFANFLQMELTITRLPDSAGTDVQVLPCLHTYLNTPGGAILRNQGREYSFAGRAEWQPLFGRCAADIHGVGKVLIEATSLHSKWGALLPYIARWSDNPNKYCCPEVLLHNPDEYRVGEGVTLRENESVTLRMRLKFIPG